jgi:hypothetical protein
VLVLANTVNYDWWTLSNHFSVVAYVYVAAVSSGSTIPAFGRHVTVLKWNTWKRREGVNRTDLTQDGGSVGGRCDRANETLGTGSIATGSENIGFSTRIVLPGPVECGRHIA